MNLVEIYTDAKPGDWIRILRINDCGFTELRKHNSSLIRRGDCYEVERMDNRKCNEYCGREIKGMAGVSSGRCVLIKGEFLIRIKCVDLSPDFYLSNCFFEYEKVFLGAASNLRF